MYIIKNLLRRLYYLYLIFDLKTCAEMPQIKNYKRDKAQKLRDKIYGS